MRCIPHPVLLNSWPLVARWVCHGCRGYLCFHDRYVSRVCAIISMGLGYVGVVNIGATSFSETST